MTDTNENLAPSLPTGHEEHAEHYNEPDLWQKLRNLPKDATAQVVEKALLLRELLLDGRTPLWVRGSIVGVLGYLILPLDLIPDPLPGIGFVDDVAAMALVLSSLDAFVTEDIRRRARKRMPAALREEAEEEES